MSEREILSAVFPAHADLQPILKKLREKYGFPKFGLADKEFAQKLLSEKEFPWDEIKQNIKAEVEAHPEIFPDQMQGLRLNY